MSFYKEAYPTFPAGLPNVAMGTTITVENNLTMTGSDLGRPYQANKFQTVGLSGTLVFELSEAQYVQFKEWWTTTLLNGRIAFEANLYLLGIQGKHLLKPLGNWRREKTKPDLWKISFAIWGWSFPTLSEDDVVGRFISRDMLQQQEAKFAQYLQSYYDLGDQPDGRSDTTGTN
ncbi:hypothetical protein pVco14_032 [Vibrio phage pVco-14]|nr:hypothetical protein pVco14_032 [Vibrio phage pVco-14]